MRKVFIPQLPTRFDKATNTRVPSIDTNPAAAFGELVTMYDSAVTKGEAITDLRENGVAIGPDDYIMAVGDITLLVAVTMAAVKRNGKATLLRWSNAQNNYFVEEVIL